jgi:hypothetical protein
VTAMRRRGVQRHKTTVIWLPLHGRWWRARDETATKGEAFITTGGRSETNALANLEKKYTLLRSQGKKLVTAVRGSSRMNQSN